MYSGLTIVRACVTHIHFTNLAIINIEKDNNIILDAWLKQHIIGNSLIIFINPRSHYLCHIMIIRRT